MDSPQERVFVTEAEIDAAIGEGGYLAVGPLGLEIKTIYRGTQRSDISNFTVGNYAAHKDNIASVLIRNIKKIFDVKDEHITPSVTYQQSNGENLAPSSYLHAISIKHPSLNNIEILNVNIEVLMELMLDNTSTNSVSNPALTDKLKLKTTGGVVFTLGGVDALLCKYLLLGDLYNVFRYFPKNLDNTSLLLHAFNHASVPLHSNDIMEEMIPAVIEAILPTSTNPQQVFIPLNTLTQKFQLEASNSSSKTYQMHYKTALASPEYSGIGKLFIVSALLLGRLCKNFLKTPDIKLHNVNILMYDFCNQTLKSFLQRLCDQANCDKAMCQLISDIYNNTKSLKPGSFKDTFHARIEALASRMGRTTVKDLLPVDQIGSHVMSKHLPQRFKSDSFSLFNWNLQPVAGRNTHYPEIAKFIFNTNAFYEYDFFALQATDVMELFDAMHKTLTQQWLCSLHTDPSRAIFYNKEKWKQVDNLGDDIIDETIQICFFEHVQDANKKLLVLHFDREQNRTHAEVREDIELIKKFKEIYPEFTICGVGFFNYPIPLANAVGISSTSDYDLSHPKEACFIMDRKGLSQVIPQTVDSLNPREILKRPVLPMQAVAINKIRTLATIPQLYQFCLLDRDKKQYCLVSYDLFLQRLTKRLRYDEILVSARQQNPQANLPIKQLQINDYGMRILTIQIPDFLSRDQINLLKERLRDIGASVGETNCELQVLPLTSKYASWKEITDPRFINDLPVITAEGTEKLLHLPDVLMRQFLDNLEEMLANALYRQSNPVLQKLHKALQNKGVDCWSYIVHVCKEMVGDSQSSVLGLFGYKKIPDFDNPADLLVYAIAHTTEHLQYVDSLNIEKKLAIQQYNSGMVQYCEQEITQLEDAIKCIPEPHLRVAKIKKMLFENLKLALENFPETTIINLKQLVIAEQKEQLKAFFAREVTRLTPRKERVVAGKALSKEATNDKIAAYENLFHYVDLHPLSHEISNEVMQYLESIKVVCNSMLFPTENYPNGILIGIAIKNSTGRSKEPTSLVNFKKTAGALVSSFTTPLWDCFKLGAEQQIDSEFRDWVAMKEQEPSSDTSEEFNDTPETPEIPASAVQLN